MGQFQKSALATRQVRFPPISDQIADIAGGPFRADFVAKVPKGAAANFPPKNERATITDQQSLKPATGIACEFGA